MARSKALQHQLDPAYENVDLQLRISRNRIACLLGVILMPIGGFLDHMLYPALMKEFIVIRMMVVMILGIIFLGHYTEFGKKHIKWLGIIMIITLNLSFCIMMYLSTGVLSRYHSALSLMILSSGILLPWTVAETLLVSVITLFLYFSSCLLHGLYYKPISLMEWDTLMNNSYFILLSGIIAATSSYFNTRARINDFELRQELDSRNKELEELDRLKSRFFANISHELRTPLTLILAPIEDLIQNSSVYGDKISNLLKTAHSNALRLLRLVNDLLDVIKLEEGKMRYQDEPVDLGDFLAAMVDSMRHLAESNQIKLTRQLSANDNVIIADSYLLERIFINLLGNAIKFTPSGGSIHVAEESNDDSVIIEITDTGIGISKEDLPYIFDRFHQAGNSSTHRSQGTGLGLALVKELTEKMHGHISVTSELGAGTTMHITFPLAGHVETLQKRTAPAISEDIVQDSYVLADRESNLIKKSVTDTTDSELPEGDGPLVMVVDDEPDMRNYLISTMKENYRVIQAQDGDQALKQANKHKPDLMLLDLMLPKIDGLEVCRILKQSPDTKSIKIMLLTARIDEGAKINALKNGADDFLTKPFSKVEVQTRIRNLLQTADLENNLRIHNKELKNALSELKQTQAQLIHSEKINALGKLTAGLLHEINNPLNYALTALQMIKRDPVFKDDEVLHETFQDIDEGMNRIKSIICELQVFAHPSESNKQESFSIKDTISNALRFTSNELGDIQVIQNLNETDEVFGSRGSIVQILINLLSNASKAIAAVPSQENRKGEITISTETRDNRLYVHVRDNGIGIDQDTIQNIFDPFFTSRDVGEGMGLGLSICHTIAKNHGGQLTVVSEHGNWTEFSFDLRIAAEADEDDQEFKLHAVK